MNDILTDTTTTSLIERNKVFDYVRTMLAEGMIDIDLDNKHIETSLNRAIARYRQRSSNSVEESYSFLELIQDQNEYRLPDEIITIKQVFRRAIGSRSGMGAGGTLFEPFSLAYTNTFLMSGSMMGGLATYEMFAGYQKLVGKMFGSFIEFKWKATSHILDILQRPFAQGEQILIQTYNFRPDFVLLQDIYCKQWLYDYTLATSKLILGEARSVFSSIAGPTGGGITLNGNDLKTAAKEEIAALDKELELYMDNGMPMSFICG
ncbi:MAG: hypothetical protein WCK81_15240 [Betaproteobacteria bacterium]